MLSLIRLWVAFQHVLLREEVNDSFMTDYLTQLFNLNGKVATLTGAGGYPVSDISAAFAKAGIMVALLDINMENAESDSPEPFLFIAIIAENIGLCREGVARDEIVQAAELADAHDSSSNVHVDMIQLLRIVA